MNFCSDNATGVSPEIMAAIGAANCGAVMSYGDDEYTQRLQVKFSDLFETSVTVFPVATGSAANALALAVMTPPYGAVYCHAESHINLDECGAPEFFTGGAKLVTVTGARSKIEADTLAKIIDRAGAGVVHHVQPAAVSITQATEAGTLYHPAEIARISEVVRAHNLHLHMDGARFANAVVSLGCSPADITWRAGVDILSFGATKNGAMAAEAVVFFNQELAKNFPFYRKRSGHLFSKMRFLSSQLEAYITDDLWLKNAANANNMAAQIAAGLAGVEKVKFCHAVEANEIFIQLPESVITSVLAEGFMFYRWDECTVRLVTAFNTREQDVIDLVAAIKRHK
ncbi:low specificity L-threonine aldolase [Microcoleus sp. LEGE 07076]|uniref:threonine aldolase family protein n=1 Tax=Microcoleus sp. LEGE 07076 TaxID=915322 RepID=UPI001880505A|nr:low specificity L-threonine aldolase [Microcoleus sp. LEGE 07076]MBE9186316.1 low specificity L-threonine aldolase [Microcoleus sp. LEGE 07076]